MSGNANSATRPRAVGRAAVIEKPFRLSGLTATLESALQIEPVR